MSNIICCKHFMYYTYYALLESLNILVKMMELEYFTIIKPGHTNFRISLSYLRPRKLPTWTLPYTLPTWTLASFITQLDITHLDITNLNITTYITHLGHYPPEHYPINYPPGHYPPEHYPQTLLTWTLPTWILHYTLPT